MWRARGEGGGTRLSGFAPFDPSADSLLFLRRNSDIVASLNQARQFFGGRRPFCENMCVGVTGSLTGVSGRPGVRGVPRQ